MLDSQKSIFQQMFLEENFWFLTLENDTSEKICYQQAEKELPFILIQVNWVSDT